ncbi:putative ribonuclease H-like domain-containing protein [Tanacetum coccineum]
MKPFRGVLVTILNTRDHLGKFDGKADERIHCELGLICPKYSEGDARMKPTEVDEYEASDKSGKHDQEARSESERIKQSEMQTEHSNSTNGINTVSTPVSTVGPSIDTAGPSPPVNTDRHLLIARIKAIRLILAYASFKDFVVYQMDVKSDFLYGKIEEEVYVCQPPGFEDPHFPDKVYKVEKALYGLHQAPRAWFMLMIHLWINQETKWIKNLETLKHNKFQRSSMGELSLFGTIQVKQKSDGIFISQDKYVAEILKKFDFASIKTASTPMETNKALVKDEKAKDVDVHLYRSMIGSLMYLTASKPDIMFPVCACARFQVTPKTSHFNAVKRIFRYLKGQPKLGLWYPRDSPFDLEAFSDSDYVGASLDRKSTTRGCQFLGKRLISWQCKKLTIVANSTTEAEYVAAANCYGQVLWIQNQMLDYGFNFMNTNIYIDNESTNCVVKNPVSHSKTKHIEIRHHFIKDSYEKKLIQVIKIHTDQNVADLLTKAFDVNRFNFLIASIRLLNL